MKALLSLLLISFSIFAADMNYNVDSSTFYVTGSTGSAVSKAFLCSPAVGLAMAMKAKDTARIAGIDSINAQWGYQLGYFTGVNDTTWQIPAIVDSIDVPAQLDLYNSKSYTPNTAGSIYCYTDTAGTGTTHVFKQTRFIGDFAQNWSNVIRFWVIGSMKNSRTHGVRFTFWVISQDHLSVRTK